MTQRRGRPISISKHGTTARYRRDCRCDECRAAWAAYRAKERRGKAENEQAADKAELDRLLRRHAPHVWQKQQTAAAELARVQQEWQEARALLAERVAELQKQMPFATAEYCELLATRERLTTSA